MKKAIILAILLFAAPALAADQSEPTIADLQAEFNVLEKELTYHWQQIRSVLEKQTVLKLRAAALKKAPAPEKAEPEPAKQER